MARKKNQKTRDKARIANLQNEVSSLSNKVKSMSINANPVKQRKKARKAKKSLAAGTGAFGPVTSITTAPVAIGNSIKGSSKTITKTANGIRLRGRDFMFTPIGSGSVTTWTLVGGMPLSPAAFADSVIANYQRMYMKFKFHSIVAHYITSSPTSSNGDVLFYYGKDRTSVFLNQTSSQLLPFVLTDENTVLGPQWTNHSAKFNITGDWKLTDYGMHDGIEEYADGELFLLSKTTTTDSPGYVIFDYDIEFAQESFQPRLLAFPIPRIQWYNCVGSPATVNVTQDSTPVSMILSVGSNLSGVTSTAPSGFAIGDIYKVVFDITNSTSWGNVDKNSLLHSQMGNTAVPVNDGFTCYALATTATVLTMFPNVGACFVAGANTAGDFYRYGVTNANVNYNVQLWISFVGSQLSISNNPNF